ncbi:MAG: glycosyltransferase family 4 protein [bacterium]|nr:glycosyltransferase family 4 protein [bacterium]
MAKKKILYVITKSNWGGAQRYVFDLATNLPKERFDVAVAAGGNDELIQKLNKSGIRTISLPHLQKNINTPKELLSFYSLFKIFIKERPDIVHLNSSKIGGLGAIAARFAGVPKIIFTAHGWAFHENRPWWQQMVIIFLSWIAALFQDKIIHLSKKDIASTLKCHIANPQKILYIPLGIIPPVFLEKKQAREILFQKIRRVIDPSAILIGTIAELTKNKGLAYLVDAINKLQTTSYKLQAIIIGEGEEKENLQKQINSLGLQNLVHLAGFIPNAAEYLRALDIFVLPSVKEGLPYTILEAMNAELPIIATSVGGISDIIETQKNGIIVRPQNIAELALSITELIKNPDLRLNLGENAHKEVLEKSTLEKMLAKTQEIYEN